jgi:predicted Zn-dependent protease with MMP-like domain
VTRAIAALPARYRSAADNLLVVVENRPSADDWPRGESNQRDDRAPLFGIYRGVPLVERAAGYNAVGPDVIAVFCRPLLRYCRRRRHLEEEISRTVWHEFGHYLGLDEAALEHL